MDLELPRPRPPEPYPEPKEIPYNHLLDYAPFDTMKEAYACPPANVSRILMTEDIPRGQANQRHVQKPLDPMCLNKPFPEIWLIPLEGKVKKLAGGLVTNRRTNPLDPKYTLPSGPSIMPSGFYRWTNRTMSQNLRNDDIEKSTSKSLFARPCRCILPGENVPDPWKGCKPKKWTWMRNRTFHGVGLELHDIDIGKRYKGFIRQRPSNPLEPLYPTEPEETPEMKYRRMKIRRLAPRRRKTNPCEKALDNMYWRAEQLPVLCRLNGQPQPNPNAVTFDAFRYTLETLGLYYTDDEFERFKPYIDPDKIGAVRYLNLSRQLKHNDGFHIDIPKPLGFDMGYWGMPATLGQGLNVLENVPKYGKSCIAWEEHQQIYNPLTGVPVPMWSHKPPIKCADHGAKKSPFQYNYLEVLAKIQEEDRAKGRTEYMFFPPGPAPTEIQPPTMPEREVSLAGADVNQRPEWCQHWDALPEADLAKHTCEKPAEKDFHMASLKVAKEIGSMVRRDTVREIKARKESQLYQPRIPQNNRSGSQVNWVPTKKFASPPKVFIPDRVRQANDLRRADIETVKGLQIID